MVYLVHSSSPTQDHDCQFRPVACPNEGCNEIITKSELKNHLENKCGFRIVSCKHCKKKLKAIELEVSGVARPAVYLIMSVIS